MQPAFDPFAAQREADKAQLLANLHQQQGPYEPPQQTQQVGNQVVPYSPVAGFAGMLAKGLDAWGQRRAAEAAIDKQTTLEQGRQQMLTDAIQPKPVNANVMSAYDYGGPVEPTSNDALVAALKTGDWKFSGPLYAKMLEGRFVQEAKANEPITPYQQAQMSIAAADKQRARTQADYDTLDQGSNDIQKAIDSGPTVNKFEAGLAQAKAGAQAKAEGELPSQLALKQQESQNAINLQNAKTASGVPDEDAMRMMANQWLNGDRGAVSGMSRNVQFQSAFRNTLARVAKERGMSDTDASQAMQNFNGASQTILAFDKGRQGDSTRSLNVVVQHLGVLNQLASALQNGDIPTVNRLSNWWKEQTGSAAPTNAALATQLAKNEIQKATLGGPGGEAEREILLQRFGSGSPEQQAGAINTGLQFATGQLKGLRKQYESSTGRQDYTDKLFPETIAALGDGTAGGAPTQQRGQPGTTGTARGVPFRILP